MNSDSLGLAKIVVIDTVQKVDAFKTTIESGVDTTERFIGMPISIARILIPILIFIIGLIANWFIKKYERKREILSFHSTITIWLNNISLPISKQISKINEFTLQISNYNDEPEKEFNTYPLLADKINEISLNRYIETFVLNTAGNYDMKSKEVFNMISSLKFIEQSENLISTLYERYLAGAILYKNEVLKFIEHTIQQFPNEYQNIETNNDLYNILNYEKIIKKFIAEGNVTNSNISSMRKTISTWKKHNDSYKEAFEKLAIKLNNAKTAIEISRTFFNSKKLKHVLLLK